MCIIHKIKNFESDNIHQQDNLEMVVKHSHCHSEVIEGL